MEEPGRAVDFTPTERGFTATLSHRRSALDTVRRPRFRWVMAPAYVAAALIALFVGGASALVVEAPLAVLAGLFVAAAAWFMVEQAVPPRQTSVLRLHGGELTLTTEGRRRFATTLDRLAVEVYGSTLALTGEEGRVALHTNQRDVDLEVIRDRLQADIVAFGTSHEVPETLRRQVRAREGLDGR